MRQSTTKVPPGWDDGQAMQYSVQQSFRDLKLWASSTELEISKQGPAVVQRLSGVAKEIGFELMNRDSVHHVTGEAGNCLQYGAVCDLGDDQGNRWHCGLDLLVHNLAGQFGQLSQEAQLKVMMASFSSGDYPEKDPMR